MNNKIEFSAKKYFLGGFWKPLHSKNLNSKHGKTNFLN